MTEPYRLPPQDYPKCGYTLDAHGHPADEGAKPSEGDLSICINCTTMLQFDKDLKLNYLTDEAFAELPAEVREELLGAQRIMRMVKNSQENG